MDKAIKKILIIVVVFGIVGTILLINYMNKQDEYRSRAVLLEQDNIIKNNTPGSEWNYSMTNTVIETHTSIAHSTTTTIPHNNTLNTSEQRIMFYIFGLGTCPHCHNLKMKILKYYGEKSLVFYDLAVLENREKYMNAFDILSKYTFSSGVPQTGIFKNGVLKAVILGDFGNDDFTGKVNYYISLVDKISKEYGQQHVLIYSENGVYYVNDTEQIKTLTDVFLHPEKFKK